MQRRNPLGQFVRLLAAMNRLRARILMVMGAAMIVLIVWAYQLSGLSWITIAIAAIAAGCVTAMAYLWWVSSRTARTLDDLRSTRKTVKPNIRQL